MTMMEDREKEEKKIKDKKLEEEKVRKEYGRVGREILSIINSKKK